jgi:hypothetical protein
MARRKIGATDHTTMLLLFGGVAVVGIYLLTRPQTILPPGSTPYYGATPYNPANTTAQDIQAGGSAVSNILNILGNQGVIGG